MAEQLQIQVQANVSNAITNLNNLQKNLAETNTAAVKTGTTGMQTLAKGAGQANTAMINLGRTVSDAPFGFIGIANNIGPLVENFVSLRKESGSSGSALKQLGSSLIGAGGLIVGIQLAVAAVQFAELGFSRWTKSTKKQKEEQDKLKEGTDQLVSSISKQKLEVETLVKVAKDVTLAENDRVNAIKRLNDIIPDNIGKLTLQNIATAEGTAVIREYIKAVEAKATAELIANRIAENNIKLFDNRNAALKATADAEKQINDLRAKQNELYAKGRFEAAEQLGIQIKSLIKLNETNQSQNIFRKTAKEILADNQNLRAEYERLLPAVNSIDKSITKTNNKKSAEQTLQEKINNLLEDYNTTIKELDYEQQITGLNKSNEKLNTNFDYLKRIALLGGETSKAYAEIASKTQFLADAASKFKIDELIKNYQTAISELDIKQAVTGQDQLNARINAATDALIKLKTLGVESTNEEFIKLQNTLNGLQAEVGLREIRKRTEEITKTWERFQLQIDKLNFNKTKEPLDALKSKIDLIGNAITELKSKGLTDKDLGIGILSIQFEQLGKQFDKLKAQKELFDQLQQTISGGLTNAFTSVFEAIANGEDAFKALGDSVKRLALDLIRVVIQMQVVKALSNIIAPGSSKLFASNEFQTLIRGDTIRRLFAR
jgi:hypothetical protein